MSSSDTVSIHATAVSMNGRGVLLAGGSGCGKSDLALRLIDRGATLIADDMVIVSRRDDLLFSQASAKASGRLHVRGIGIIQLPATAQPVPLAIAIRLGRSGEGGSPAGRFGPVLGLMLPEVHLAPFELSATVKVALALDRWGL